MMTPDQRYFFDLTGYLHLEGVLQGEELQKAQEAAQRYIDTPPDQVPDGFEINLEREHFNWYLHAFAFDKALEALTMHPVTWPIIKELLDEQPILGQQARVVEADAVTQDAVHVLAVGRIEAEAADRRGHRLPFLARRYLGAGQRLCLLGGGALGEADDVDR